MSVYIVKIISAFLLPPGILLVLLGVVTWYQYHCKTSGRHILAFGVFAFYVMTIPLSNEYALQSLEKQYSQPVNPQGDVIIMLGGGAYDGVPDVGAIGQIGASSANRLLATVRLYERTKLPIILSGGKVFADTAAEAVVEKRVLMELGVPEDKLYLDSQSRNTAENARYSQEICNTQGWYHPIVVTSAFHMPRAVRLFERAGMEVTAYPTDYWVSIPTSYVTPFKFLPQSMGRLELAAKEYLGMAAIRWGLQ